MGTAEFSVKARKAQACMSKKVIMEDRLPDEIKLVAGVDAAYVGKVVVGAAVVLDYKTHEVLEAQTATLPVKFPYVPTLLSFRELPAVVAAIRKLKLLPEVFLVDGHGRAHPFRCGFASHLGLVIGKPTVGVAKSRLVGEPVQVDEEVCLVHNGEVISRVVFTRRGSKPVYVSVGHMVSLASAVKIVEHCTRNSRMPEPILKAHNAASKIKAVEKLKQKKVA